MLEMAWNSVKQINFGKLMKDKLQDDVLHHNKIDLMPLFGEILITDLYSQTRDSSKQRKTHYFPRKKLSSGILNLKLSKYLTIRVSPIIHTLRE
jgi:hypothetical protein